MIPMEEIYSLTSIDFSSLLLSVFVILTSFRAAGSAWEWLAGRLGLETKWMRTKKEEQRQILQLQKDLSATIEAVTRNEKKRDKQIQALICGNKELLGAEIDKRYRQYIALDGIPESDVTEFDDIYMAYKDLNGNHSRDTKYFYVKDHLPVIPVTTKLVMTEKKHDT